MSSIEIGIQQNKQKIDSMLFICNKAKLVLSEYLSVFKWFLNKIRTSDNSQVNEDFVRTYEQAIKGITNYQKVLEHIEREVSGERDLLTVIDEVKTGLVDAD